MLRLALSRPRGHKQDAQALVEFALTILVFLLLIFMIIEVARILQAYVTLQNAARAGARYAVTGQFLEAYGSDPLRVGDPEREWNPAGDGVLQTIAPCWPLFSDDLAAPTPASKEYYQPFRNARTCSVEEVTIRGLAGLVLDAQAGDAQAGYYEVMVRGVGRAVTPDMTLERYLKDTSHPLYALYPYDQITGQELIDDYGYDYSQANKYVLIPGFAGQPSQKVVVQVAYRLPIVTPILSAIAPTVRLTATAVMTNEAFGSTSAQREAALPPELPPIPTLGAPLPPDLTITSISLLNPLPFYAPGDNITYQVDVANIGGIDARPAGGIPLSFFFSETPLDPAQLSSAAVAAPGLVATVTVADALAGSTQTITVPIQIPLAATNAQYYVYAWIDAAPGASWAGDEFQGDVVNEEGTSGSVAYNQAREANNVADVGTIVLTEVVDLKFDDTNPITASVAAPNQNDPVIFTVIVRNLGPSDANGVYFLLDDRGGNMATGFALGAAPGCTQDAGTGVIRCDLGTMAGGTSQTITIPTTVIAPGGSEFSVFATVAHTDTAQLDVNPANNQNDIARDAVVKVGAVDLSIDIVSSVTDPELATTFTYTVTVRNASPNGAAAVTAMVENANPPAGIRFLNAPAPTVTQGSITSIAGDLLTWNVGDLPGNTTAQLVFTAEVIDATDDVVTTATITSTHVEVTLADYVDTVTLTPRAADLSIVKTFSPVTLGNAATVAIGNPVSYRITVTNQGNASSTGITVIDKMPAGLVFSLADASILSGGGTLSYNAAARELTWTGFNLAAGASAVLTYTATVDADAYSTYGAGPHYNVAEVTATTPEDVMTNNSDTNTALTYANVVDLELLGWVVDSSVTPGPSTPSLQVAVSNQTINYILTVTNNGLSDAENVYVELDSADLPNWLANLTVLNAAATQYAGTDLLGDIQSAARWNVGLLPAGSSATLTIFFQVENRNLLPSSLLWLDLNAPLTAVAKLPGYPGSDVNTANNTATITRFAVAASEIYVNVGSSGANCSVPLTWGIFNAATPNYKFGHPFIGLDQSWRPWYDTGAPWAASGVVTFYDTGGTPVYYADGDGNRNNNGLLTADGLKLFANCRAEGSSFTLYFDDLAPGQWQVIFLFADYQGYTNRILNVTANGTSVLSNYVIANHVNDDNPGSNPNENYVIVRRNATVTSTYQLALQFTGSASRPALVQGIGLRYIGP